MGTQPARLLQHARRISSSSRAHLLCGSRSALLPCLLISSRSALLLLAAASITTTGQPPSSSLPSSESEPTAAEGYSWP
jgi:hypothetical protein